MHASLMTIPVPGPPQQLWDPDLPPVLEVTDRQVVSLDLVECTNGQITPSSNAESIAGLDWDDLYPLVGPIVVAGAVPGDAVEIEILDLEVGTWGHTAVLPGLGLLSEDFADPHLHIWNLTDGRTTDFLGLAQIPLRPFPGVVGTCPDVSEPRSVFAPGPFGGNLDCRDVVVGSRILLPVGLSGGRLAVGDPHAAQGDGEVCASAIEASLTATARIRLHRGLSPTAPQLVVPASQPRDADADGFLVTMGVEPDLGSAARAAVRRMIEALGRDYGLDPLDAYVLCSVAVNLKVTQCVGTVNVVVSAYLSKGMMR